MVVQDSPEQRSKQTLRRQMLAARQALSPAQRGQLDLAVCGHLLRFLEASPARVLSAFHAFRGEPDLAPALAALDAAGYRVHLPIIVDLQLSFRRWTRTSPLVPNRYGIPEPQAGDPCAAEQLDCVLMPLVAFSAGGVRLGMGGGYYDRTFAFRLQHPGARCPQLVGVAYSLQQVDTLPREPWDVPLDALITDQGVHYFKPSRAPVD